jgi:hypothetical protein
MRLLVLSDSKAAKCTVEILQFIADNKDNLKESGIIIKVTSFSIQEYNNPTIKAAFTKQKITSLPVLVSQNKQIYGKKIKDYITNLYNRNNRPKAPPEPARPMPEKDDGTINEDWDVEKAKREYASKFTRKHHKTQIDENKEATAEDIAGLIDDDKPAKRRGGNGGSGSGSGRVNTEDDEEKKLMEKIGIM